MKYFIEENNSLIGVFECVNFNKALDFIHIIGNISEIHNHHPDILLFDYKFVKVVSTTHDAQNKVTKKDIALANSIESSYKK